MKRLRILHTEASSGWGGQEIRILDEAAGLIARGHDVQLAAPAGAPIAGEDFYRALLRIWLGDRPVQDDLKKALLGG